MKTMKTLLIVESPAKSKTIEKLLGPNFVVLASFGHIRNLPNKTLGIDIENGFTPTYKILADKRKQIKAIEEMIRKVDRVLLASDEDREGEAIAWHCAVVFRLPIDVENRIVFHEITKTALETAVAHPRKINMDMVMSQQARRIVDRLVGFELSPLLWKHVGPKLSAGRVQSVALRLIVDKENALKDVKSENIFRTIAFFKEGLNGTLSEDFERDTVSLAFLNDIHKHRPSFIVKNITSKKEEQSPPPPFTTSTIQQECSNRYGISSKMCMNILQGLYETGRITYHRTDSTNINVDFRKEVKAYVEKTFGKEYVHERVYKSKIKCAQEAHEAIRITHLPFEKGKEEDGNMSEKIYKLIWKRTIASQMKASVTDVNEIRIDIVWPSSHLSPPSPPFFISRKRKLIFEGYRKIYCETREGDEDGPSGEGEEGACPEEGTCLHISKMESRETLPKTGMHYHEATLIKAMEGAGIGRPSTYAYIVDTLLERRYVERKDIPGKTASILIFTLTIEKGVSQKKEDIVVGAEKKRLLSTFIGQKTADFLGREFPTLMNTEFTMELENKLDGIVNEHVDWRSVVKTLYDSYGGTMATKSRTQRGSDGHATHAHAIPQIGEIRSHLATKSRTQHGRAHKGTHA